MYKNLPTTTRTSLYSRNKTEDNQPRLTTYISVRGSFGNKVQPKSGYSALTARGLDNMPGNAGRQSGGVIHTTSVSRPQLKCYQVKDKVVPNNSQVKFQKKEVEDHHRISSISKKTKSVTACNDSSNSRTSNEMLFVAECGTCVLFNLILFIVDSGMHDEAHDGQNQRCVIVVEKFTGYCSVLKMNQFAPILG
ncbi:hypothetical protein Tco_1351556 [Tanacetum coccineum]